MEDLRWLGLDWDEGPETGGPNGPYFQSPRTALYQDALEKMGLPAGETVFVDDTLKNLHGAAALGIQTVQICAGRWSPSLDRTFGIDGVQAAEQAPEAAGAPEGQEPPRITKISQLLELLD